MYVCSCFGITEQQVKQHAEAGLGTPRQIASACKAGTDCGGCVRRIQALLGRGDCPRRQLLESRKDPADSLSGAEPVAAPATAVPPLSPTAPVVLPEAA
ncbi:bacterioferritin-associated ferredoxin [uncultured Streptomyces sp.]|uniref:(2Fe-2S)-binding protein n=1 Tax=uncultured Streptomyces sp. TaxID=174707 RepID=UPI00262DC0DC|nr:(2Fe-2S)-binding protein [uncultured Streptomyces sp.]